MEILGVVGLYLLQQKQTKEVTLILFEVEPDPELDLIDCFQRTFFKVWTVPQRYLCTFGEEHDNWACSQDKEVPCWVSRPWEKWIFLIYMLVMSIISILVIIFDLCYTLQKISTKKLRRRREKRNLTRGAMSHPSMTPRSNGSTTPLNAKSV